MPFNLTTIIPWPYRILAAVALAVALVGFGWVKGASHVQDKFGVFQGQVSATGKARAAKTVTTIQSQKTITANTEAAYAQGDPALRNLYGPGRVRKPGSGGRPVPAVPGAASGTDARPADPGPGADVSSAGSDDQCAGLKANAAVTTREYLFLRDWVERQRAAMSDDQTSVPQ